VYVLDFGSIIDHGTAQHVQQSVVVRDAYLGATV
jgi:ABC-type branched-subunit amino acid transport system ATPase component